MDVSAKRNALFSAALAGTVLLMAVLALTPGISFTEDLGRHLLLGQIISEQHSVPRTNFLTYTNPDFPFVNHHWLSEVLFYQLHRVIGYNGLILFKVLAMAGALGLAMSATRPRGRTALLWLAGILAAVMLGFRAHIRPELFTFLGVGFFLFCFERIRNGARWPWLATGAAMWLWSNTHIYFIFGLFMCAAFVFEAYTHRHTRSAFGVPLLTAWFAAVVILCSLNPNGLSGLLYPFRIFSNYEVGITENSSVLEYWRTVINPMMIALPLASVLALWAAWANRRIRPANSIILLAAFAAALWMARSVPLLALALLPAVAGIPSAECRVPNPETQGSGSRSPVSGFLSATTLLFNALLILFVLTGSYHRPFPSPIGPTPFGFDNENRYLALRGLQNEGLPGHIFTDYNIGSLAEYNLWPEQKGYVDNRPEAFPGPFWRTEYRAALALGEEWEVIRRHRAIETIIVSLTGVKDQYTRELMRRPEWALVHIDALLGVWVYDPGAASAFARAHGWNEETLQAYEQSIRNRIDGLMDVPFWRRQVAADELVYALYSLICIGQAERAWPMIHELHAAYPDYQIVHELMRVTAPPEGIEEVKAVMARRARWPVAAKQVLDWGRVLESEGKLDQARMAYRRGRLFFPLSPDLRAAGQRIDDAEFLDRSRSKE